MSMETGYIVSHFERAGRFISEQMVTKICELVDHYPSYVQHLASIVLSHTPQGGTATEELLPLVQTTFPVNKKMKREIIPKFRSTLI